MSKLLPLNGVAVLKKLEESETTYGQIVIPDMGKEKPDMGVVVSSSDTFNWHRGEYYQSKLKPGQKVLIPRMGTMSFTLDGEDYILIKETEILSIIED